MVWGICMVCNCACIAHRHIFSQNRIVDTITADSTKGGEERNVPSTDRTPKHAGKRLQAFTSALDSQTHSEIKIIIIRKENKVIVNDSSRCQVLLLSIDLLHLLYTRISWPSSNIEFVQISPDELINFLSSRRYPSRSQTRKELTYTPYTWFLTAQNDLHFN